MTEQQRFDYEGAQPGGGGPLPPPPQKPQELGLGQRVGRLRRVRLQSKKYKDGKIASAADQKLVLWCIADHAGNAEWFITYQQIAEETGLKEKRVQRAVAGLKNQGVIGVRRKRIKSGRVTNHYRVNWPRVRKLGSLETATGDHSAADPETATGDHSGLATGDHSELVPCGQSLEEAPLKAPLEAQPDAPPPPPTPLEVQSDSKGGDLETEVGGGVVDLIDFFAWAHYCTTVDDIDNPVGLFTSGLGRPIWGERLSVDALGDTAKLLELYGLCLGQLVERDFEYDGRDFRDKLRNCDLEWAEHQLAQRVSPKTERQLRRAAADAVRRAPHVKARIASVTGLDAVLTAGLYPANRSQTDQITALQSANFESERNSQ